jgi:type IV pilus assembly protein PilO
MKASDLKNLEFENIGQWPWPLRAIILAGLLAGGIGLGYTLDTRGMLERLESVVEKEHVLRAEFERRQRVIANIDQVRAQLEEGKAQLDDMLRQLPTRTEMPDLLEDISNTGRVNGLIFDRFKPESEVPREFYSTQPISIRARGTYHQFGAFLSGVSSLPRIVTVANLAIREPRGGRDAELKLDNELILEATLHTYRYLEDEAKEVGG